MENLFDDLSAQNQDALDDLIVAIEASGRQLGIYIAVCDDLQLRSRLITRYEQNLSTTFRHYRLTLNAQEPSLTALLRQQVQGDGQEDNYLQQGGQAVMSILGAERLDAIGFEGDRSPLQIFFGYLQWTREALSDFPFAIVMWVTYALQKQLIQQAPDFWSWRREVVRF